MHILYILLLLVPTLKEKVAEQQPDYNLSRNMSFNKKGVYTGNR